LVLNTLRITPRSPRKTTLLVRLWESSRPSTV
jgi:hypothetical protein